MLLHNSRVYAREDSKPRKTVLPELQVRDLAKRFSGGWTTKMEQIQELILLNLKIADY